MKIRYRIIKETTARTETYKIERQGPIYFYTMYAPFISCDELKLPVKWVPHLNRLTGSDTWNSLEEATQEVATMHRIDGPLAHKVEVVYEDPQ